MRRDWPPLGRVFRLISRSPFTERGRRVSNNTAAAAATIIIISRNQDHDDDDVG